MAVYNDALRQRIEALGKVAIKNHSEELAQFRAVVGKELQLLNNKVHKLNSDMLGLKSSIQRTHQNHNKEINVKADNITESMQKIVSRTNALERENKQLLQQIKVLEVAVASNPQQPSRDGLLYDEIRELKNKIKAISQKPKQVIVQQVVPAQSPAKPVPMGVVAVQTPALQQPTKLGLSEEDLKKLGLKAKLDEQERLQTDYVGKKFQKSYVDGIYQTWTATNSKSGVAFFTLTIYGYQYKTADSAANYYKYAAKEAHIEESHSQEPLSMADDGMLLEKPINTLIVKGKEVEIGKAEAVFYKESSVYIINASYLSGKLTTSDMKTLVAGLCKK